MEHRPQSEFTTSEATERVEQTLADNDVVLFMKGSRQMPECAYSRQALQLLTQYREDIETVDVLDALEEYRAALAAKSGWETLPQAYVDGDFIGGNDMLAALDERGELEAKLME